MPDDGDLYDFYLTIKNEIFAFVDAHEMSHILKGHFYLSKEKRTMTVYEDILYISANELTYEWEADIGASYILFNGSRRRYPGAKPLREIDHKFLCPLILSGILIFCYVSHCIDVIVFQTKKKYNFSVPVIMDHPPGEERMNLIIQYLMAIGVIQNLRDGIGVASIFLKHFNNMDYKIWKKIEFKII